jgi:hypothetical protein
VKFKLIIGFCIVMAAVSLATGVAQIAAGSLPSGLLNVLTFTLLTFTFRSMAATQRRLDAAKRERKGGTP